ncbi:MAG TPA: helicase C-terminal domain-containing protein [Anaerolineae bacterium]|nr:helicase C-terminal domain-containing protein [Anaerolineae bacterium]
MSRKRMRSEWEDERERLPRRDSGPPPPGFRPDLPDEPPAYLLEAEWAVPARPPRYEPETPAPRPGSAAQRGPAQPAEPPPIDEPGNTAQGQDLDKPIDCPPVVEIFQAGGEVAQLLGERYRPREGQIAMAELVRQALNGRRHAVVEAGTGIGKSFAYLAPAIWSRAKAVVSTSNKALMSQLWRQDLPDLQRIAPRPFTMALLKGRSNYLCNLRVEELLRQRQLVGVSDDVERVEQGLAAVPSGDTEEMGLPFPLRQRLTVSHRECGGRKCPLFDECFYEQAKIEAAAADIIVTNHALLCFSTLRSDNKILPVRPILIVDEAHELPGYAIGALSQGLEFETLAAVANHPVTQEAVPASLRQAAMEHNGQFFASLLERRPQRWSERWVLQGEIQEGIRLGHALDELLRKLSLHKAGSGEAAALDALQRYAAELVGTVHALSHPEPESYVRYCEMDQSANRREQDRMTVLYRPLEVAEPLSRGLFGAWPRIISTSATLSVADDLGWFRRQVGAPADGPVLARRIASPFNYREQVLIYVPRGVEPAYEEGEEIYLKWLTGEVRRLVRASRGRAFVLCTSRRRMEQLYDALEHELPYPCYSQGGGLTRQELLEQFKADGNAVLFGTRSFWEGVDVPGEALSLVILDKIPFVPHQDPVQQREEQLVRSRGGNPFEELQLAHAILTLRQGAGRLVRAETDRGVIALLDARIHTKQYGRRILAALPAGRQVAKIEEVEAFFGRP